MKTKATIVMVGPSLDARGGISSVVTHYLHSRLIRDYRVYYVDSHKDGSVFSKLMTAWRAYMVFLYRLWMAKPDIVHIHGASRASFYRKSIFILMARLFNRKILYHHHGGEFMVFFHEEGNPFKRWFIRWLLKRTDRIITLSQGWKQRFLSIDDALDITVLPNPVAIPSCGRVDSHSGRVKILFLGKLCMEKGVDDLVSAAIRLRAETDSFEVLFYGNGDRTPFVRRCRGACLEQVVSFHGWVDGVEKNDAFIHADVFVLPSYNESMPMGILEAMSYGLPVVATSVGGIPDMVMDGESGFLVVPGDIEALADRLARLISDRTLRENMGRAGRAIAVSRYEVSLIVKALGHVYESLI